MGGGGREEGRGVGGGGVVVGLAERGVGVEGSGGGGGGVGAEEWKRWVIYRGGIRGGVMMRFVAGFFLKLLEVYTRLETAAYLIIAWISVKLGVAAYAHFMEVVRHSEPAIHHLPNWLFWPVMVALFATGFIGGKKPAGESADAAAEAEGDA